jgi:hypothetical protein
MKKVLLTCVLAVALSPLANALIINLGSYPQPGGGDGPLNQLNFLNNTVIPAYNLANDPDLSPAVYGTENIEVPEGLTSITLTLGNYDYLKLKWSGNWQYYYIGGTSGDVIFNSTAFNPSGQAQDLGHYTFFSPSSVPEGGLTVGLLGLVLAGLGLMRRSMG